MLWYHLALRWHPNTVLFRPKNPCDSFIPSSQLPLCLRSWICGASSNSLHAHVGFRKMLSSLNMGWGTASFLLSDFPVSSFMLTSVHSIYWVSQHGYPVWPCSHYFSTEVTGRQSHFRKIWTKRPQMMEIKKYSADTQANKGKQTPWLNWGGTGQRYRWRIQLSLTRINK